MAGGWASLGLLPELVATVEDEFQWHLPTDIQDEAIPLILGGSDVMASAETGSGKTAAFALPITQLCAEYKERKAKHDLNTTNDPGGGGSGICDVSWQMSLLDCDNSIAIKLESRGLHVQSRDETKWGGCRANHGIKVLNTKRRQFFYCCKVMDDGGFVRVGWATEDASLQLGNDKQGWGYGSTGKRVHNREYVSYPSEANEAAYGKGDVIGCHLTLVEEWNETNEDHRKNIDPVIAIVSYSKNGKILDQAFEIKKSVLGEGVLYPIICLKNSECILQFTSTDVSFSFSEFVSVADADKDSKTINSKDSLLLLDGHGPLSIVIEPTRDLAEQTYRVFDDLCHRIEEVSVQAALLVGGVDPQKTLKQIKDGKVDILVGTPPILASYMKKKVIQPTNCRFIVLDEADELVSKDTIEHINTIYSRILPAVQNRSSFDRLQVCFFSATLESKEVRLLANTVCHQPLWIKLRAQKDSILPKTVHHCIISIDPGLFTESMATSKTDAVHRQGKLDADIILSKLEEDERNSEKVKQLKMLAVIDVLESFSMDQVLIFCRTNLDCDLMESFLRNKSGGKGLVEKYSCRVLAGMRSMKERQKSLQAFKDGEVRILLATDVAARGIDIQDLFYLINMTLPDSTETYVHRSGRVGRAKRMGMAISLVSTVKERVWWCRKGEKPPCTDTRDFEKGGNCIWINEPDLLSKVEKVLQVNEMSMITLDYPALSLPPHVKAMFDTGGNVDSVLHAKIDPILEATLKSMENQLQDISQTEFDLQTDYWTLRAAARARLMK